MRKPWIQPRCTHLDEELTRVSYSSSYEKFYSLDYKAM
jgi:hypothetical protein